MSGTPFDDLSGVYDVMIDWPKRLAHEEPFYRRWFQRVGASRVLDAACGTGRHAALFHGWNLVVEGADLSPAMIEQARTTFGAPPGLQWTVRGFDRPVPEPGAFDAVVCVGNSLALAGDFDVVDRAVAAMLAALRPGGVLLIQVLNLWRMPDGPCVWQKCRRVTLPQGEALILKGVHRCGERGYVDLVVADPQGSALRHESVPFLGLEPDHLQQVAQASGAARVMFFGDYRDAAYDRASSVDLVMAAQRR